MNAISQTGRRRALRRVIAGIVLGLAANLATTASAASITLLPIKVCNDAGMLCANDAEELFLEATNKIWAQAGLSFNYLPFTSTDSSEFLNLDNQAEVNSLFMTGPGSAANPYIISMWFVASHFDAYGEVNAVPGNRIVIEQSVFSIGRLDTIAHEVGHLLGLNHGDAGVGTDFLMRSGGDRVTPVVIGDITPGAAELDKLTAAQIAIALADPKVNAIPEPATFAMMLGGLGAIVVVGRRGIW